MSTKAITPALLLSLSILTAGCGNVSQGQSPVIVRIDELAAAPGNKPDTFGDNLLSDVSTVPTGGTTPTIFNDLGRVTMEMTLKNPGVAGGNTPTELNVVTFTHYHVEYVRTDGHNIQGVDVPYAFDSGLTFSVPTNGTIQAAFTIVKDTAKEEAPLKALTVAAATDGTLTFPIINTITNVTFYGKDQSGNDVSVMGSIGIDFANFADPTS